MGSIILAIGGFVEALVGLRFLFRLIGVNPASAFVSWVYDWSTPLVAPFAGMFNQNSQVVTGNGAVTTSVFDWTALIALVVYGLVIAVLSTALARRHPAY